MSQIAQNDDSEDINTKILQEKLQDLLLMNFEKFIDKFRKP